MFVTGLTTIAVFTQVNVDPVTEEVLDVSSDYVHTDVDPHTHSLQLDNLVRNRHYQIEVTAVSRVGPSILKYTIKKFIYCKVLTSFVLGTR